MSLPAPDPRFPTVFHLEAEAKKRMPRFGFDYLQGATGEEAGMARNRQGFRDVRLVPRYLRDVDEVDISAELFGRRYSMPIGVAPVGLGGIMWPNAAEILAEAAARADIPFVLSTMATTSIETIAPLAGDKMWFQLYLTRDEAITESLLERAAKVGVKTLMVTVDIPSGGRRPRDIINGLTVPPRVTFRNVLEIFRHPNWALQSLQAGIPRFRNLEPYMPPDAKLEEIPQMVSANVTVSPSAERIKWVRKLWKGELIVKGIQHTEDAMHCVDLGADGILVSNHGGRQLDCAPSAIECLPEVVAAVGGRARVMLDSGARSGEDAVKALALGADMVFMGRPFYFALGALGRRGGDHVMALLQDEFRLALKQIGCTAAADLDRSWLAG